MRGAKIEDEECCESSSSKRLSRSSSSCTSSNSSSSGSSSHKNNANGKNTNMRRWYDPNSQSVHEGCRCSCQQQRQDDAIHLVTTTTATATGTAAAAGSKRRGGVVDLCSRSKAMKLESEEEDEEEHEEQMLEEEHEEHEEREEEDRLLQEDEDDAHTVPVFAGQEDQENSPASGVVDGEAEMESEMGAEMQPEDDPMDVERFLNCELDEDPCEEQHSNVAAAAAAAATTPTTTIDLEFLGLCCDHDQALCDEDFAIRKNTIASSSPAACDYGEVDDLISFSLPPPPPPRVIPPTTIEPAEEDDPFWKLMQQQHVQRRIWLRLDYEDVLNAWPDRRPFVSENASAIAIANAHRSKQEPPQFQSIRRPKAASAVPEDSTSDIAGSSDVGVVPELSSGSVGAQSVDQVHRVPVVSTLDDHGRRNQQQCCSGEGREARVSRYREKRRTRLFSKKIRYEVRKLNAERRPRLKGRFVKRSTDGGED